MMLVVLSVMCFVMSFFLFYMTKIMPIFTLVYFDYIALFVAFVPAIILLYKMMAVSDTYKLTEKIPKWKHYIAYMRRDNKIVSMYGTRTYPGESFIDVPNLGLVEFLGKDCWYNWGDKKILWGLENLSYTPDPRYSNLCHLLSTIGFSNSDDIKNVLTGNDLNLMGKTWLAMDNYDNDHGIPRLINDMMNYDKKTVIFNNGNESDKNILDKIDKFLSQKEKKGKPETW